MCFSAMTVCGLNVVSLSALQPVQQAFLFILMLLGDIVSFFSWWELADVEGSLSLI